MTKPRGINYDLIDLLGKAPDVHLAAMLGVSRQAVRSARLARGIKAAPRSKPSRDASASNAPSAGLRARLACVDVSRHVDDVAVDVGCSKTSVYEERKRRGVVVPRGKHGRHKRVISALRHVSSIVPMGVPQKTAVAMVAKARGVAQSTLSRALSKMAKESP